MAGLDIALNTGVRSLLTRQKEMATTGQNLANAEKPGYHKRTTKVQTTPSIETVNARIGTGVQVEKVTRAYDTILESNLQQAVNKDGYHQKYAAMLKYAEDVIAPDGESSLQTAITDFANAWQDVASQPESTEHRKNLIERGKRVAEELNLTNSRIDGAKNRIWDQSANTGYLVEAVNSANRKAEEIATLNKRISQFERRQFNDQQANELRDQRDKLLNELSRLTDITVKEQEHGVKTVQLDGRDWIGNGEVHDSLEAAADGAGGVELKWTSGGTVSQDGGETEGYIESYGVLNNLEAEFETFATTMRDELNSQHASGYDLDDNLGTDLFQDTADGWQFQISDARKIAASSEQNAPGNGENAQAMWDRMHDTAVFGGNDNISNYVDRRVDDLATEVQNAQELAKGTEGQVEMLEKEIQSKSGVNSDEEMRDMLETQRAYQASSRFVTVVDEMLASAIRMV